MPNLIDLVGELAGAFNRIQVRFAVGGALANNYWGVVRTTQDIDCLIAIPAIRYQQFADELCQLGCVLNGNDSSAIVPTEALREQAQNRKFIECFKESVRIELFVPAVPIQDEILRRAVVVKLGDYDVPITTAEDLILLKLAFHRQKDLRRRRTSLGSARSIGPRLLEKMEHAVVGNRNVQQELEGLNRRPKCGNDNRHRSTFRADPKIRNSTTRSAR